jgi:L-lactate dehydrogenase complex protein LldG
MSDPARERFLAQVRQAVREGNHAGGSPPLPERSSLGYQGAGADPVARFHAEFEAAGGRAHVVPDDQAAVAMVLELVRAAGARSVLLGNGPVLDRLNLAGPLVEGERQVIPIADLSVDGARAAFFAADVGVSGVRHLIAETGSLVVESSPAEPRSLTLLPPVHIAVAGREQILPDLFDLFTPGQEIPSNRTLITGPSKTGDIELRLVTGVHGPGEIHVVLIAPG